MLRSKPMASFTSRSSKLSLSSSLEKEESCAKRAELPSNSSFLHLELPYHEKINSKAYKLVFAQLTVDQLKEARLVCRKWHQEIYPLLEERTCFQFQGVDDPSDLERARNLSIFLNVVPKDSFQWKMLKALYPKPEDALPIPVLIQWSQLRVRDSNYYELRQFVARTHVPNVSFLELLNVRLNWSKYLLIFREFEGLSKFHDTSLSLASGIWDDFEKGCAFNERLISTEAYKSQYYPNHPDLLFHSRRIKEIKIRRARLEEVILFMKLFLAMECTELETLQLSAEDTQQSFRKNKERKNSGRLQEPKTILFAHLGSVLSRNGDTLQNLKLSFRHSSISTWFEQYTKEKYEDPDGVLYKPDLRDFILFIKHHRWHETIFLRKLQVLQFEFENKQIPSVEEIEYLTTFISTLTSLTTLTLSHFLLTSYNSLSMPLILNRIEGLTTQNGTVVRFGVSLRNSDIEGLSQSAAQDRDQLPRNLELFYSNIKSLIVTCHSHDMDVRYSLFPWIRQNDSLTPTPTKSLVINNGISTSTTTLPAGSPSGVEDLWVIDERPAKNVANSSAGASVALSHHQPLFHTVELVSSYPNLVSLIIRDSGNALKASGQDLCRWTILDDYGLQLVLGGLTRLKHFDVKGNLFFITDYGITGLSPGTGESGQSKRKEWRKQDGVSGMKSESRSENEESGKILQKSANTGLGSVKRVSFTALKALEYCSLEYLGPKVTSTSLKYGFNGMDSLKYLRIAGLIQVDPAAIQRLKNSYSGCQIDVVSSKQ